MSMRNASAVLRSSAVGLVACRPDGARHRQHRDARAAARSRGRRVLGGPVRRRHGRRGGVRIPPRATAGIQRGDILLAINGQPVETRAATSLEYQHHAPAKARGSPTRSLRLGDAAGSRRVAGACRAAGVDVLRAGRASASSRCSSAPRSACAGRAIRRRCISSGCASPSSARSRSRSTGPFDRLDWTFYWGDAVAMALLPPLLLHFTLGVPASARRGARRGRCARCCPSSTCRRSC